MGFLYVASFEDVTVTAQVDFFEILPATQRPVVIHAVSLTQNTDAKDANEELIRVKIIRGHSTSGSGGTAATEVALDPAAPAASAAVETNNTTIASAGTAVDLWAEAFNNRTGWLWIPTPEMRPKVRNAELIVVRLMAAITGSDMSGVLVWEEL